MTLNQIRTKAQSIKTQKTRKLFFRNGVSSFQYESGMVNKSMPINSFELIGIRCPGHMCVPAPSKMLYDFPLICHLSSDLMVSTKSNGEVLGMSECQAQGVFSVMIELPVQLNLPNVCVCVSVYLRSTTGNVGVCVICCTVIACH